LFFKTNLANIYKSLKRERTTKKEEHTTKKEEHSQDNNKRKTKNWVHNSLENKETVLKAYCELFSSGALSTIITLRFVLPAGLGETNEFFPGCISHHIRTLCFRDSKGIDLSFTFEEFIVDIDSSCLSYLGLFNSNTVDILCSRYPPQTELIKQWTILGPTTHKSESIIDFKEENEKAEKKAKEGTAEVPQNKKRKRNICSACGNRDPTLFCPLCSSNAVCETCSCCIVCARKFKF